MSKVDLHTHSNFSDGTSTPLEVAHALLKSGVVACALTDHDTMDGVNQIAPFCKEHNILFSYGVEISTGEHDHLHFTGYNIDPNNEEFSAFLLQNRTNRTNRIRKIIKLLADAGLDITEEDVFSRAPNTVSRAHVADALHAKRIVDSRQEAFRKYLVPGMVGYVPSVGVSAIDAIKQIKKAGGIAVIAHPGLVQECWNFPAWVEAGLDGVEVFYPAHTFSMRQDLLAIVRKYGLFASAGSDYHGPRGGRTVTPGMNVPQEHYDRLIRKIFNR